MMAKPTGDIGDQSNMTTVSARLPFEYYVLDRVVFEGALSAGLRASPCESGLRTATDVLTDLWDWPFAFPTVVSM